MQKINVKQRSLSWLNMRATRIGASEAWGLIHHYATDQELLSAGIDPLEARKETPYISAYGLYQKIKGNPYPSTIDVWDSQFGEAVEFWVRSQYKTKPKAEVYYDKLNICSLDLADAENGPWNAAVVEIKSRREIAEQIPLRWQLQTSLQCRAKGAEKAIILQIALDALDEHLRTCVAFSYTKFGHKKFLSYFDGLPKKITPTQFERDDRLLALYDVCCARFWHDVDTDNEPTPILADEPNSSAVALLLASYTNDTEHSLARYVKLKGLEKRIKEELAAEKQKAFVACRENKAIVITDGDNTSAKWSANGALLVKQKKA